MAVGDCVAEAHKLLTGDRAASYGDYFDICQRVADSFNVFRGANLTVEDVATIMILMKLSREQFVHKRDNCVDGAGYFDLLNYVTERRQAHSAGR